MRKNLLLLLTVVGCTPSGYDATLADRPETLTSSGGDKLFDLEITAAESELAMLDLQLTFQPAGGTMTVLNFQLSNDANGDGAVGTGDVLTAIEPGIDLLGTSSAGQTFGIKLAEKLDASRVVELWDGTWTPN